MKQAFQDSSGSLGIRKTIIGAPKILITLLLFAGISLAFSGMQTTLALLGENRFGLNESQSGYIFFLVGMIVVFTQAGVIGPLSKKFADMILVAAGLVFLVLGFIGLSGVTSLISMLIWVIPLSFGSSIANPSLGAFLSKQAPPEQSGIILGLNQGVGSLMRIIGPLLATILFEINAAYPYYLGAVILTLSFMLAIWLVRISIDRYPELPCRNCGTLLREGVAICQRCGMERTHALEMKAKGISDG
jgi:MFS family permease